MAYQLTQYRLSAKHVVVHGVPSTEVWVTARAEHASLVLCLSKLRTVHHRREEWGCGVLHDLLRPIAPGHGFCPVLAVWGSGARVPLAPLYLSRSGRVPSLAEVVSPALYRHGRRPLSMGRKRGRRCRRLTGCDGGLRRLGHPSIVTRQRISTWCDEKG